MNKFYDKNGNEIKINSDTQKRRRKDKTEDLLNKGIGVNEIALILEVDVSTVRAYIAELRDEGKLENVEIIKGIPEVIPSNQNLQQRIEAINVKIAQVLEKNNGKRLNKRNAEKLVSLRRDKVKIYHEVGHSILEIAQEMHMTEDQVREDFCAMNISIYTPKEIEELRRKQEEQERVEREQSIKQEEEAERERKRQERNKKRREREKAKRAEQAKQNLAEKEKRDIEEGRKLPISYIIKKLKELIEEKEYKKIKKFIDDCLISECLSNEIKANLIDFKKWTEVAEAANESKNKRKKQNQSNEKER